MLTESELGREGWVLATITGGQHLKRILEMYEELGLDIHLEETSPGECAGCTECYQANGEPIYRIYTKRRSRGPHAKKGSEAMPVYEYKCTKCGRRFELRRSVGEDDNDIKCPECGSGNQSRVFSTFAKGSSSSACTPSGSI